MNKSGFYYNLNLKYIVAFFIVIYIIISFTGLHIVTTVNGEHTGQVTAVEDSGLFFKTTTVYFKSDAQSSQEDSYCLIDKSLSDSLVRYSKNKTQVTIHYMDYFAKSVMECGGESDIIIGVESINN